MGEKKILIWCGGAPNQKALAHKIAGRFKVCGIVVDQKRAIKKQPLSGRIIELVMDKLFFTTISGAWKKMQQKYNNHYPAWPDAPLLYTASINSDEAFTFSKELHPDLVVVSGTSLIRAKMLSLQPSIGIINLHTGLSPYIKGGPNCTDWCIANGEFEKIGNTIMWINKGIDSGNIITSECTPFNETGNSLEKIQWQVMEHAHDLYLRAIDYLLKTTAPYQSVPQKDITEGKLFLTKMWGFKQKRKLLKNLSSFSTLNHNQGYTPVSIAIPE